MAAKAVFLDRDNTIIRDPGYISDPAAVQLLPGVTLALKSLTQAGFKIVVVTNQSGVARGLLTEETLKKIHEELQRQITQAGAKLDGIYYCPYHPEGSVAQYSIDSDLRKPAPGMILKAAHEMNLDLAASWMVGDSARDIEAGKRSGCKTIRIVRPAKGQASLDPDNATPADYRVHNLVDATRVILRHAGRQEAQADQAAQPAKPAKAEQQAKAKATESAKPVKPVEQPAKTEPAKPAVEAKKQEPPVKMKTPSPTTEPARPEPAAPASAIEELTAATQAVKADPVEKPIPQELSLPESNEESPEPKKKSAQPAAQYAPSTVFEVTPDNAEKGSHKGESLQMALTPPKVDAATKHVPVESKSAPSHAVMPPEPAVAVEQLSLPASSADSGAAKARPDDEFAWASLAGGIAQMIVIGPLAMAIVQIIKQEYSACAAWALLACVFQIMALTCYTIHRNK